MYIFFNAFTGVERIKMERNCELRIEETNKPTANRHKWIPYRCKCRKFRNWLQISKLLLLLLLGTI